MSWLVASQVLSFPRGPSLPCLPPLGVMAEHPQPPALLGVSTQVNRGTCEEGCAEIQHFPQACRGVSGSADPKQRQGGGSCLLLGPSHIALHPSGEGNAHVLVFWLLMEPRQCC